MDAQNLIGKTDNRKKSLGISIAIHTALIVLGLIPLASSITIPESADEPVFVPVVFAESTESSGSTAGAETTESVVEEVIKPVTETEAVVEETIIEEVAEVEIEESMRHLGSAEDVRIDPRPNAERSGIGEDVVSEEQVEEVEETNTNSSGATDNHVDNATGAGGDQTDDGSGDGAAADGVITRRVIHRADIAEAAATSGVVVVDICIDRKGRILTVKNNADGTTVDDIEMVRHAMEIAAMYRFETDYSAALRECGSLTFIFDIESGLEEVQLMADAGIE